MSLADLRRGYARAALLEADASPDPIAQCLAWIDDAIAAAVPEPNAMTLATVDATGQPSARIVLLKGLDERGFVFFTSRTSRKGRDLAADARAALCLHWIPLERQVRVEGTATQVADAEADAYFASRPRESQLGAWASSQSEPIGSREALEARFAEVASRFPDVVPRPPTWGGYRVAPSVIELWQGRPGRLHDRLRYTRGAGGVWTRERLCP